MTGMAEPLLKVSNIETYYGPIMAIRGVSFEVPTGSIVTVLGANGAGKTTILKTISGVMDPQKGSVVFEGREIQRTDPDRVMRLGISHVPEGREVFPFLTVRENLMMGAYTRRDRDGIARDVDMVFDYFPMLRERADQRAGQLSGGEQQMLSIARALLTNPSVLLMDEPTEGLAPVLVEALTEVLSRLRAESALSIILVEQNSRVALAFSPRTVILDKGRIVYDGESEPLRADPERLAKLIGIVE
jgi:branched-chain amino acid transport system ATP-binding protein